jgi:hypothetical protein
VVQTYWLRWDRAVVRLVGGGFELRVSVNPQPDKWWCGAFDVLKKTHNGSGVRGWRIHRHGGRVAVEGIADGDEADVRAVLQWMVWEAAAQARRAEKEAWRRECEARWRRREADAEEAARRAAAEAEEVVRRAAAEAKGAARRHRAEELTARFRRGASGRDDGVALDDNFLSTAHEID